MPTTPDQFLKEKTIETQVRINKNQSYRRLLKEASNIAKAGYKTDALAAIETSLENVEQWSATFDGPVDSPYEGCQLHVLVDVPKEYPCSAPKIKFITPIFHPNISEAKGYICLDLLNDVNRWSPTLTIEKLLLSVLSLLTDPNPAHGLNSHAIDLFRSECVYCSGDEACQ